MILHSSTSISYLKTCIKPDGPDNYLQQGNMLLVISGILHSGLGSLVQEGYWQTGETINMETRACDLWGEVEGARLVESGKDETYRGSGSLQLCEEALQRQWSQLFYIEAESKARTRSCKIRLERFIVHTGDNLFSRMVEEYCNGLLAEPRGFKDLAIQGWPDLVLLHPEVPSNQCFYDSTILTRVVKMLKWDEEEKTRRHY